MRFDESSSSFSLESAPGRGSLIACTPRTAPPVRGRSRGCRELPYVGHGTASCPHSVTSFPHIFPTGVFALKATRFSGQRYFLVSNFSCTRSACEATDELDSAVGHSSLALQKILQAQVLLLESFRVIHSHVTVMPG